MDKVIIEGVRCFVDRQVVPLRPLTVLVGENSSGKSTFLALTRIAWDLARGQVDVDFNEEPFPLGAYEHVISLVEGWVPQAQFFAIGVELSLPLPAPRKRSSLGKSLARIECRFSKGEGQPRLVEWVMEAKPFIAKADYSAAGLIPRFTIDAPSGILEPGALLRAAHYVAPEFMDPWRIFTLAAAPLQPEPTDQPGETTKVKRDREGLRQAWQAIHDQLATRPYAFAPIRTQPQRTYDPLKTIARPEGSHVPMILARLHASKSFDWELLKTAIEDFGKVSGLFTGLDVRRLGTQEGDPFQIVVRVAGPASNLIDVGYGVSQILPIIVDILRGEGGRTFLLQQPEVHLHPRAQAELGTFLATVAKTQKKRFVVETHSDYIVDRIRMDVRDRKILKAGDVIILYFERKRGKTTIHPIEIDEFGNLKNVPKGYRAFFLQEERRFLEGES